MTGAPATLGQVLALQDLDCIDRLKLRYRLDAALPSSFFEQFQDAKLTVRRFSATVPQGRDLFSIQKSGTFRADGIVGDRKIVVTFDGDPLEWPMPMVEDFGTRLLQVGYSSITYRQGEPPRCHACALRASRRCQDSDERLLGVAFRRQGLSGQPPRRAGAPAHSITRPDSSPAAPAATRPAPGRSPRT